MEDTNVETDLEINYQSEASAGDKRKREGKLRSKVWQHFTKILKEDGKCDKCQCNHCQKLFTCSSRSGTTHLLRHITDGICPVFKKDKSAITISSYSSPRNNHGGLLTWKFDGPPSAQRCTDVEIELAPNLESQPVDEYENSTPSLPSSSRGGKLPAAVQSAWMNEFRSCVGKLVELANGKIAPAVGAGPDYSISAALRCLNEMEDIPQTSEMYLDAFEILQDAGERECFICLPPEPRRRWMQRVLHRRHPLRYGSNLM
ncbi:zinc finger bed domain-containing protein ricesleeper 3 [Phtheirospermum japonicum]|uniref:Zinc finger bed domain-containing protein ricesleeper 3 n=1 Tax=Phtheirospermum japonicum TaxID=374723 RepID=A0A830B9H9_9LAMI|nr:zinc finger bed domain-containing protein ricesleeper 3 [Phtheirospermum japonicum]